MTENREPLNRPPASSTNVILIVALVVLSGALVYQSWLAKPPVTGTPPDYIPRTVVPRGDLGSAEQSTISVFRQTSPSVVFIRTKGFQPFLFGGGGQEQELSSGTGVIWDAQGHVVTNLHVVEDAIRSSNTALEVQFADRSVEAAEFIGGVREHDIAVLKINVDEDRASPIPLGTSDDLQVGQQVLAIGSPFGFDQTLSTGVIGGLNRSVAAAGGKGYLDGLIQTDAAINPGNSGGPLLDSSGRMIGVNTAIVSPTGAYSGLGFAVSVSSVIASVDMVLQESSGHQKPVLGISILSPEQAAELGVPEQIIQRGLFIKQVDPTGPAADIDLRPTRQLGYRILLGDQIAAIDGESVTTLAQLQTALEKHSPGDTVALDIFRGSQRGVVQITLQARKLIF